MLLMRFGVENPPRTRMVDVRCGNGACPQTIRTGTPRFIARMQAGWQGRVRCDKCRQWTSPTPQREAVVIG